MLVCLEDMMGNNGKTITVKFIEEELNIIHDVFDALTKENLHQWTTLIPKEKEYHSAECFQQWLITGKFDGIRHKIRISLGLEKPLTDEELDQQIKEAEKIISFEVFKDIFG